MQCGYDLNKGFTIAVVSNSYQFMLESRIPAGPSVRDKTQLNAIVGYPDDSALPGCSGLP